jgi:hypothetical protein
MTEHLEVDSGISLDYSLERELALDDGAAARSHGPGEFRLA